MTATSPIRCMHGLAACALSFCACAAAAGAAPRASDVDAAVADLAMPASSSDMAQPTQPLPVDLSGVTTGLPVVVDDDYVTSGFMGDGTDVVMTPAKPTDSSDCSGQRSSLSARGSCHQIVYTPKGPTKWAGVFWQSPPNNWGEEPGFPIPPGATEVTFQAKGARGGEKVTFQVGGIADSTKPHQDQLKVSTVVTLTASWAPYTIVLASQSYGQVLGGFCWSMAAADAGATATFFVDDIQWK